jgi:hypothetical protein
MIFCMSFLLDTIVFGRALPLGRTAPATVCRCSKDGRNKGNPTAAVKKFGRAGRPG